MSTSELEFAESYPDLLVFLFYRLLFWHNVSQYAENVILRENDY